MPRAFLIIGLGQNVELNQDSSPIGRTPFSSTIPNIKRGHMSFLFAQVLGTCSFCRNSGAKVLLIKREQRPRTRQIQRQSRGASDTSLFTEGPPQWSTKLAPQGRRPRI